MEILIKASQFFLSLSILIILHELGHFLFARLFNTRVEKFYLFFNPWFSIFKFKKGDTEYGLGWLPLGGYVKISGMIDESMDKEQMSQPPQPYEFRSKPSGQRLLIMLGGVMMNFLLAMVIYVGILYAWGDEYLPTENAKYGIVAEPLAQEIGLQSGDKIISVDNEKVDNFHLVPYQIILNMASNIQVNRNGELINIPLTDDDIAAMIRNPRFMSVRIPFIIDDFSKDSPAKAAGMMKGDQIIKIQGENAEYFDLAGSILDKYKGEEVKVTAMRNNQEMDFSVLITEEGKLEVYPLADMSKLFEIKTIEYGLLEAFPAGISKGWTTMSDYLKQFKLIFSSKTKGYESIGGFITIGSIFPGKWNWEAFWSMTALLSIVLAIMNMLPIPALDGGHVMFLLYEIVAGRKPGDKFLEYAQITGMIILISLLIYANGNDIVRLINK